MNKLLIVVESKYDLYRLIEQRIKEQGTDCNLNDIDVTKVTDMSYLFAYSDFNGDISNWDVFNVKMYDDAHIFEVQWRS